MPVPSERLEGKDDMVSTLHCKHEGRREETGSEF